jgi:uncharacterized protein (DUF2164 family)
MDNGYKAPMQLKLDPDAQARARASLKSFYRAERGEELGDLAADLLLEFFCAEIGPELFNLGVRAAKRRLVEVWDGIDEALELVELRPDRRARKP